MTSDQLSRARTLAGGGSRSRLNIHQRLTAPPRPPCSRQGNGRAANLMETRTGATLVERATGVYAEGLRSLQRTSTRPTPAPRT